VTATDESATASPRWLDAREAIDRLLHPGAVALVGASDDLEKFSGQPLRNLQRAGYRGAIHPVNRRAGVVSGLPAVPTVTDLPSTIDTAMVMVPATACAQVVRDLGTVGIRTAIVAVSGFAEMGTEEGRQLQQELAAAGRQAGVRLVGPNCNGVYETREPLPLGYNYTHSQILGAGSVALVAHSGAMLGGFVPLLESFGAGLSAFVSCGNEVDLTLTDYVEYFVEDPDTNVIALILDGVHEGRRLRRAVAAAHAVGKSVVALKLGNSANGSAAASAHSSRLAGSRVAYEAVFAADDVVAVPTLETLAIVSGLLAHGRRPESMNVVGLSTSGAGGVLLADVLGEHGFVFPHLAPQTLRTLTESAGFAQAMNPFDIGAAGAAFVEADLAALAADPGAAALVFYLTPTPTASWRMRLAEGIAAVAAEHPLMPVLVVSPAPLDADVATRYRSAGVPVVTSTLDAARSLQALVAGPDREAGPDSPAASPDLPVSEARAAGRSLSEPASRAFLRDRGVPVGQDVLVGSAGEAIAAAETLGFPVVLKAAGAGLVHKTEDGLVRLGVPSPESVRQNFEELELRGRCLDPEGFEGVLVAPMVTGGAEVVVGVSTDPDFGPMLLFGAGGVTAELVADVAVTPVPVNTEQARALIGRTRVSRLLSGYRGTAPLDVDALVDLLVAVADMAVMHAEEIVGVDLNPVRVLPAGHGVVALDALVVTT